MENNYKYSTNYPAKSNPQPTPNTHPPNKKVDTYMAIIAVMGNPVMAIKDTVVKGKRTTV